MPQYGYGPVKRFDVDSSLTIPTTCGVPLLRTNLTKKSAIAFDTCNNRFYFYNAKTLAWDTIKGGSGSTIDTTSLSNRINLKLSISDSGSMLNPYLRKIDTTNKWVNSVTKLNDSTLQIVKGVTTTNVSITTATNATRLITKVWNKSGATITKGSVVYIDGAHSSVLPSIALAKANAELTSAYTYGLVVDDIANNSEGTVIQNGTITNLNLPTTSYTDGQILYLSPTIAGGYTTTKPLAPNHYVAIGTITRAHPNFGTIQVAIRNGFQLDEMSDVSIPLVPSDSVLLQFSRVDSLWHDVSPTTAIGSRYIKPSDTATMLSKYFNNTNYGLSKSSQIISVDTSTLSNKYHRLNDSLTYFSKYRSDTMRTNIYTAISGKQASGSYITVSDTSVFQRKNIASYSFQANNTNASANVTTQAFRDTSYTLSGSDITWVGTTAPSGTKSETIRWTQVGSMVTINITLYYSVAGSANTGVNIVFPSSLPAPFIPSGMSAASRMIAFGNGTFSTNYQQPSAYYRGGLRRNSGNTGNEFFASFATGSGAVNWAQIIVTYSTN